MTNDRKHRLPDELMVCRVCGRRHETPPWGHDGISPSYEICPCCGVEFGYDDATRPAVLRHRALWRKADYGWSDPILCPPGWRAVDQIAQIPDDYRDDQA